MRFRDIHIRAISQKMPQPSVTKIPLEITYLQFHSYFLGAVDSTFLTRPAIQYVNGMSASGVPIQYQQYI